MKIDWKALSKSPGYISLKSAYIKDVMKATKRPNPMRKKEELLKLFNWVIARAQHYAHHHQTRIDLVLLGWETDRTFWWLNYYQEGRQPKLPSGRPRNVKPGKGEGYIKRHASKTTLLIRLRSAREREAHFKRAKIKPARWNSARKNRATYLRSQGI